MPVCVCGVVLELYVAVAVVARCDDTLVRKSGDRDPGTALMALVVSII